MNNAELYTSIENSNRDSLKDQVKTAITRLNLMIRDIEREAENLDKAGTDKFGSIHGRSYVESVGQIQHILSWGYANLSIDAMLNRASEADTARLLKALSDEVKA